MASFASAVVAVIGAQACADTLTLAQYTFGTGSGTTGVTTVAPGVSAGNVTNGPSDSSLSDFETQNTSTVGGQTVTYLGTPALTAPYLRAAAGAGQTASDATLTPGRYFFFDFRVTGSLPVVVSSLSFDFAKGGGTTSTRGVDLTAIFLGSTPLQGSYLGTVSRGTGAETGGDRTNPNNPAVFRNEVLDGFSPLTVASGETLRFQFRTFASDRSLSVNGQSIYDNITVTGTVIPTPGAALGGLGLMGVMALRRGRAD